MEGSHSEKPLIGSEKEGDIARQLLGPKRPYLSSASSSSSSSSSKPPLGATSSPFRLVLKQPHSPSHTLEVVAPIANTEQDKKLQHQPDFAHKNVALTDASDDHHEASNLENNQQELAEVSPSEAMKHKRVVSNRLSAQRSRLRKLERMASMERQCGLLENQIALLQPQVEAFANHKHMLILEQMALRQRLEALDKERLVKQAEIERNQAEVHRLRELEKRQREEAQAQAMMAYANWETVPYNQFAPEQMVYRNIPAQGFQNVGGTSRMEVDEQTLNLNSATSMNELDTIVNPPKLNDDKEVNSEFRFDF